MRTFLGTTGFKEANQFSKTKTGITSDLKLIAKQKFGDINNNKLTKFKKLKNLIEEGSFNQRGIT